MCNLYESLIEYARQDIYPMHMPGHKRNQDFHMDNPYFFDVTEVEGMDDLYHPVGILKYSMEHIARMYGAEKSFLLINGSTAGILAAVSACCRRGQTVLMARNCHKSVYHAAFLLELEQKYIYPSFVTGTQIVTGITKEDVALALEKTQNVKCVVLTSPTYEGFVSDLSEISSFLHEQGIPLIVDEAHGAHLRWNAVFPESAVEAGADLVIQSAHKTLPSLTQTAVLHYQSTLVSEEEVRRFLGIYQTSSPSYVLMASVDRCYMWLQEEGKAAFEAYVKRLRRFYKRMHSLKTLRLLSGEKRDPSKIVVLTAGSGITGPELTRCLREEYKIETEMELSDYVIAMTSVADSEQGFRRLENALLKIDGELVGREVEKGEGEKRYIEAEYYCNAYEAVYCEGKERLIHKAAGEISKEYVYVYPPGVPVVIPGEKLNESMIEYLLRQQESGCELRGLKDGEGRKIEVIRDKNCILNKERRR